MVIFNIGRCFVVYIVQRDEIWLNMFKYERLSQKLQCIVLHFYTTYIGQLYIIQSLKITQIWLSMKECVTNGNVCTRFFLISECDASHFGKNCEGDCKAECGNNVKTCHHVSGCSICNSGYEGVHITCIVYL